MLEFVLTSHLELEAILDCLNVFKSEVLNIVFDLVARYYKHIAFEFDRIETDVQSFHIKSESSLQASL